MARRKAPSTSGETFLFVNSDATTIKTKRRNTKLGQQIQRHVQRGVRQKLLAQADSRKGHTEDIPKQTASSRHSNMVTSSCNDDMHFDFFLDHETDILDMSPISEASMAFDSSSEDIQYHSSSASEDNNWELPPLETIPIPDTILSPTHIATPPQAALRESPETLSQCVPFLLRFWADRLLPDRFSFDARFTPLNRSRHAEAIADEIGLARVQPAHFYSLLASIAVQMTVLGETISGTNHDDLVLWLKAKALEAIRSSLSEGAPMTHELARDIQRLTTIAHLTDMPLDAEGHFGAMIALVDSLGGLSTFDSYFIETEIIIHWYGSLRTLERPRLTVSNTVPEPEEYTCFTISTPASPTNNTALKACFIDVHKLIAFTPHMSSHHAKFVSSRYLSIGYTLLKLKPSTTTKTTPPDEPLRLALIYLIALARSSEFDRRCAGHSVHKLRKALEPLVTDQDSKSKYKHKHHHKSAMDPKLLLWISVIGAWTAQGTGKEEGWFVDAVVSGARRLGVRDLEGLEGVLGMVMYGREVFGGGMRGLWDIIRDRLG